MKPNMPFRSWIPTFKGGAESALSRQQVQSVFRFSTLQERTPLGLASCHIILDRFVALAWVIGLAGPMNQQDHSPWQRTGQGARSRTTDIARTEIIENFREHHQIDFFRRPLLRNLHPFDSYLV